MIRSLRSRWLLWIRISVFFGHNFYIHMFVMIKFINKRGRAVAAYMAASLSLNCCIQCLTCCCSGVGCSLSEPSIKLTTLLIL